MSDQGLVINVEESPVNDNGHPGRRIVITIWVDGRPFSEEFMPYDSRYDVAGGLRVLASRIDPDQEVP